MNTTLALLPPAPVMHRAVAERDATFDGLFFTAVKTTGIFCRPSCPARRPLPENVEFYGSVREALFAGYRPCRRCRPLATSGEHPPEIARLLERLEREPETRLRDEDLRAMGLSPEALRRYFARRFGMTFHAYARGLRLGEAFQRIRKGDELDDVVLGHGWESHSGFRDAFARTFGTSPGRARGAAPLTLTWIESPLGPLVAGSCGDGVCLLEFSDRRMLESQVATVQRVFGRTAVPGSDPHLERLREELAGYFAGRLTEFATPVVAPGSPFQERVWGALRQIPYGATRSYQDIAREVGDAAACRAVGTANGRNRVAIVIPCHRVVNADGKLGGYGGGLWRKRWLLELERRTATAAAPADA
jgi:AraC family transcriptional regulator of adaptative response/methylated-DNA-[protein]-cysteine methyltransferase